MTDERIGELWLENHGRKAWAVHKTIRGFARLVEAEVLRELVGRAEGEKVCSFVFATISPAAQAHYVAQWLRGVQEEANRGA